MIGYQYHRKDPKMLEVLSLLLAGAVLPFVYYLKRDLVDPDFEKFTDYATTNCDIFFDFSRFVSKNICFVPRKI